MSTSEETFFHNLMVSYGGVCQKGVKLPPHVVQSLLDENCMEYDRELVQRDMLTPEQQMIIIYRTLVNYSNLFNFASNPKTSPVVLDVLWNRLNGLPAPDAYTIIGAVSVNPNVSAETLLSMYRSADLVVSFAAKQVLKLKRVGDWTRFLVDSLVDDFPEATVDMPLEWLEDLCSVVLLDEIKL